MKRAPDLTIIRIEKLEQAIIELNVRFLANVGEVGNEVDDCKSGVIKRDTNNSL